MQSVAQGWLVLRLTGSPLFLGIVAAAGSLPVLLLSFWGGTLADRQPKRRLMIYTQSVAMLVSAVLTVLTLFHVITPWAIVFMAVCQGCVNAIDAPVRQSYMIQLVGRPLLTSALALNSTAFNAARVIGPALAGIVVGYLGEGLVFGVNTLSFLAVLWALTKLRVPGNAKSPDELSPVVTYQDVYAFIRGNKRVHVLLLLAFALSVFGFAFLPLLPFLAREILHLNAIGFGILSAFQGVGALIAAATVASPTKRGLRMSAGFVAVPLLLLFLAFNTSVAVAWLLSALLGFSGVGAMILTNTTLQGMVPDEMRGRIMSLFTLSILGLSPLGGLVAGYCVEYFGSLPAVLVGCATLTLLTVTPLLVYGEVYKD